MNERFNNAINSKPQKIPPIWFMRQAGRYHSHYQNLRKKYDFEQLCKIPEIAAEVACGPINDFDYDVAILFSDILFPLEIFELGLSYNPGPTFDRYLTEKDMKKELNPSVIHEKLHFQALALKLTRSELPGNKSLVGFVGGPWTIFSYGANLNGELPARITKQEAFVEKFLYKTLIPLLGENINMQLNSGAELVYIFDTYAMQLSEEYFINTYLRELIEQIFKPFNKKVAYFTKHEAIMNLDTTNLNDIGLAGLIYPPKEGFNDFFKKKTGGFLQGNFSPQALAKPHQEYLIDFENFTSSIRSLSPEDRKGWICSLSHGVLPQTPEENVRHFIEHIRISFGED